MFEVFADDDDILMQDFTDENGLPQDISTATLLMTVRDQKTKAVIFTKSSTSISEIEKLVPAGGGAAGSDGKTYIYISGDDTKNLKGAYEYDIQITFANSTVVTLDKDFLVVKEDISA